MTEDFDDDFGDEFEPIQALSAEEASNDRLIQAFTNSRRNKPGQETDGTTMENDDTSSAKKRSKPSQSPQEESQDIQEILSSAAIPSSKPRKRLQTINLKKFKLFNSKKDPSPYEINGSRDIDLSELVKTSLDDSQRSTDASALNRPLGTTLNKPTPTTKQFTFNFKLNSSGTSVSDIHTVKRAIMTQLSGRCGHFELMKSSIAPKYNEVYSMFEHTVRDKESHSALIIGPRAVGKTEIVYKALQELENKYPKKFITVQLNSFHQLDETIAMREIARQLDRSFAGLFAEGFEFSGSFEQRSLSDTFNNILNMLESSKLVGELSVIFILDEVEKFTLPSKQTLLYNLFDLAQNSSNAVCVCGVSTKVTTRELFEKRVRSRFSQRIITINKARTIEEFWNDAKLGLLASESVIESLKDRKYGQEWNKNILEMYGESSTPTADEKINSGTEKRVLQQLVAQNFYTVKNFRDFNNWVKYAISKVSTLQPFPNEQDFGKYLQALLVNKIQTTATSLSELELLLLVAAARWVEKYELQVVNFNLAYREYAEMVKRYNVSSTSAIGAATATDANAVTNIKVTQRIWPQAVLKPYWENLMRSELLVEPPTAPTTEKTPGYQCGVIESDRMVLLDLSLEELHRIAGDNHIVRRFTRL